jgi:hypothetical protein
MSEQHDPIVEVLDRARRLPVEVVAKVFDRYGRPLADDRAELEPVVQLADGTQLGRLRHRAPVDVIANDHFVLVAPGQPALAMPGPLFAAAIAALDRP